MRYTAVVLALVLGCDGGGGSEPADAGGRGGPGHGGSTARGGAGGVTENDAGGVSVCGDGVCAPDEPWACCQDCGCQLGFLCQANGTCQTTGIATMTVTFANCGVAADARLFDRADKMTWPQDPGQTIDVSGAGPIHMDIRCTANAKICFGASGAAPGAGLDGSGTCSSCCGTCGQDAPTFNLGC